MDIKQNLTFEKVVAAIIEKNKISHAYLIEINNDNELGQVIEFAEKIITAKISDENERKQIEKQIENRNHSDFKYISTESQWIKKEQILQVQAELSTTSLTDNPRVYVIESAEKLNKSSANTLLKFLEEPGENIIGILVTKNKHQVIDTIVSRCQFIKVDVLESKNCNSEEYNNKIIEVINIIEEKKEHAIPYLQKIDPNIFNNRTELIDFLSNIMLMYNDMLHISLSIETVYYLEYKERIETWLLKNDFQTLSRKILALSNTIERLKYNTNIKLMLDKLSIYMSGCDINV